MVAAVAKQGDSAAGAPQKPLHILHGILRDVASRLALNEAVVWVRNAAKAPPWAKLLRVEKSVLFSMGVRSVTFPTEQLNSIHYTGCSAKNVLSSIIYMHIFVMYCYPEDGNLIFELQMQLMQHHSQRLPLGAGCPTGWTSQW